MIAHLYEPPRPALVREQARALVRDAQADGLPVAILTNDLRAFHTQEWIDRIEIVGDVDVVVDGSVEGHLKPAPRLYELLAERLEVAFADMVFLDDQMTNIRGAEALGIPSVWFDLADPDTAFAAVRKLLGLVRGGRPMVEQRELRVTQMTLEAEGVLSLRLARIESDDPLPAWEPGAHIDVYVPDGTHPAVLPVRRPRGPVLLADRGAARARGARWVGVRPRRAARRRPADGHPAEEQLRARGRALPRPRRRRRRHHADHGVRRAPGPRGPPLHADLRRPQRDSMAFRSGWRPR